MGNGNSDESVLKMFMRLESNLEEVTKKAEDGFQKIKYQMDDINKAMEIVGAHLISASDEGAAKLSDHLENQRKTIYAINKDLENQTALSKFSLELSNKLIDSMGKRLKMSKKDIEEFKSIINNVRDEKAAVKQQAEFNDALEAANKELDSLVEKDFSNFEKQINNIKSTFSDIGAEFSGVISSVVKSFDSTGILGPIIQFGQSAFKLIKRNLIDPITSTLSESFNKRIKSSLKIDRIKDDRTILFKKDLKINMELLRVLRAQTTEKQRAINATKKEVSALNGTPSIGGGGGGIGGGGKGGGIDDMLSSGGAGGGGRMAAAAGIAAAAVAAIAVAVLAVVAAVKSFIKILEAASDVMEEFHTINFQLTGGQRELAISVAEVTMKGQYLVKETQNTIKALAELGFNAEQLHENNMKLIRTTAAFARVTGVADDVVAKHYKTQLALGNTIKSANTQLGYSMILMKKYGLTASDVTSILSATTDMAHKLTVAFDYTPEAATSAMMAMGKLGAAAKQLGLDVSEASSFYKELTDNATKYIVATGGKSLFQGPTETLADLMRQQDDIMRNVNKLPVAMRSQFLQQLYGLNEKQVRMLSSMKEEHLKWANAEKQAAIMRGESLGKLDLSEEKFLKAAGKADDLINNVENLAKQSNENYKRQMDLLRDKFLAIFIKLGAQVMPFIINVFDYVAGIFDTIASNFDSIVRTIDKVLGYTSPAYMLAKKALGIKNFDEESLEKQSKARELERNKLLGVVDDFEKIAKHQTLIDKIRLDQLKLEKQASDIKSTMKIGDKESERKLENILLQQKALQRVSDELNLIDVSNANDFDVNKLTDKFFAEERRLAKEADAREQKINEEAIASKVQTSIVTNNNADKPEVSPTRYIKDTTDTKNKLESITKLEPAVDTTPVAKEVEKLQDNQHNQTAILTKIHSALVKKPFIKHSSDSVDWS